MRGRSQCAVEEKPQAGALDPHLPRSRIARKWPVPVLVPVATMITTGLMGFLVEYGGLTFSPDLISSFLLCLAAGAMIFGSRGILLSAASPLTVVPSIFVVSLGLPSLCYALGINDYNRFYIKPEYVSDVNYFALFALLCFYAGVRLADLKGKRPETRAGRKTKLSPFITNDLDAPKGGFEIASGQFGRGRPFPTSAVRPSLGLEIERQKSDDKVLANLLCLLATVALACFYLSMRSEGLLDPDVIRGFGQFDSWGLFSYLAQLGTASLLMCVLTAAIARVHRPYLRLWLVPILSSAALGVMGSRGTLLPFLLFLIPSEIKGRIFSKKKLALVAIVCILSAVFIVQARPSHYGLSGFLDNLWQGTTQAEAMNPLEGLSSFEITSSVFWIAHQLKPVGAISQIWSLVSPLPSFVVKQDILLTNVLPYFGIYGGNNGTPFPLLGELFFFLSWFGALFGLAAGAVLGWLFRKSNASLFQTSGFRSFLWPLVYTASIVSAIMSMHQGMRTVTRYPIWAVVWYFGFRGLLSLVNCLRPTRKGLQAAPINSARIKFPELT